MKKFLIGFLAASALFVLTGAALVMSGTVEFSTVNVEVNGQRVGSVGETYTLGNGEQAPYSISYKDAKGGATTYLPVRKISELLGVDIQWDGANNAVQVIEGTEQNVVSTASTDDDFEWSDDEEEAYQQFCGMWEEKRWLGFGMTDSPDEDGIFYFNYTGAWTISRLEEKLCELGENRFYEFCERRIATCVELNKLNMDCNHTWRFFISESNGDSEVICQYFNQYSEIEIRYSNITF